MPKNKLLRIAKLLYAFIFILALFTLLRMNVLAFYHLSQSKGDYTLAMQMMDRAHQFNLISYLSGWLHCAVAGVMLKIILDK